MNEPEPGACPICGEVPTAVEHELGMTRWLLGAPLPTIETRRSRWSAVHGDGRTCQLTRAQGQRLVTIALRISAGL